MFPLPESKWLPPLPLTSASSSVMSSVKPPIVTAFKPLAFPLCSMYSFPIPPSCFPFFPQHLSASNIPCNLLSYCILFLSSVSSLLNFKFPKGRNPCLFCSWRYLRGLEQHQAHNQCSKKYLLSERMNSHSMLWGRQLFFIRWGDWGF